MLVVTKEQKAVFYSSPAFAENPEISIKKYPRNTQKYS